MGDKTPAVTTPAIPSLPDAADARLFDGGPPMRLLRLWGRFDPEHRHVWRRCVAVVAIGWLPLLVLAMLARADGQEAVWRAFMQDASAHVRLLVVAPLLVLAEAVCIPRLGDLAHSFRSRGVVPPSEAQPYDAIVRSIIRLRDGWLVEALAVVLAFVAAVLLVRYVPTAFLPNWHHGAPEAPLGRSLASWWHALVSLPILLILQLGWCWRIFLWARYLWLVAGLRLRLIAAHPDGAAGLMFASYSLRAFSILGVAIGALVAATELAHVLAGGPGSPEQLARVALGTVVVVLLVFTAPVLVFSGHLLRTWRHGLVRYGTLSQRLGEALEHKWMSGQTGGDTVDPLATGDFSAVVDFYQTAANAYSMRLTPVDLRSLLVLAAATALPFGLVAMALVPFDKLLQQVVGVFL